MSTLETRYGTSSPRTTELPRAFTFGEFVRGAAFACLWFQPLALIGSTVAFGIDGNDALSGLIITIFGIPITMIATIAGSPFAFVLGYRLRRRRRDLTHILAFALYGGIWGYAVQLVVLGESTTLSAVAVAYTLATSAAVVAGWWTTSRIALRADRRDEGASIAALLAEPEAER